MQSVADLAVGLITLLSFSYICVTETLRKGICTQHLVLLRVIMLPIFLSVWMFTVMTVERYIGVCFSLRHRSLVTKKRMFIVASFGTMILTILSGFTFLQKDLFGTFLSVYLYLFNAISIFVYTKIFLLMRKRETHRNNIENVETNKQKKFWKKLG